MKSVHVVAFLLLVVGGLNWLLEAFGYGIGRYLPSMLAQGLYIVIGIAAIFELVTHKKGCKICGGDSAPSAMS